MRLQRIIQDYFTFSKKERNGIIVLLIAVVLMAIANQMIFLFEKPSKSDVDKFLAEVAEFKKHQSLKLKSNSLFEFDPNTIDSLSLDSMQLPDHVKQNLLKFRKKGGRFFYPDDFRKLYGMNDSVFSSVRKYIRIEKQERKVNEQKSVPRKIEFFLFDPNNMNEDEWLRLGLTKKQVQQINRYKHSLGGQFASKEQFQKTYGINNVLMDSLLKYIRIEPKVNPSKGTKLNVSEKLELNSADSIILKSIPGIGSILSKRIVKYRDLLGGFYSTNQLLEVYGLKTEIFLKIKNQLEIDTVFIQKININFASVDDFSRHPYIGKKIGRDIVNYRSKNGKISQPSVLLKERIVNSDQYEKIRHYLGTKND